MPMMRLRRPKRHGGAITHRATERGSLRGTIASLSGAALVAAGVAFLSNILAARTLGPELRGHVAFVLQLSYFIAPLLILASDKAVLRVGQKDGEGNFFVAGRRTLVATTLMATILAAVAFQDWRLLCAPAAATSAWFLLRRAHVVVFGQYKRYLIPFFTFQALVLVSHASLAIFGISSWPMWAAAYVLPAVFLLLLRASAETPGDVNPTRNVPLITAALTQLWSLRGERILLPILAGPTHLGLYVVVATATEPLYWISQAAADHSVANSRPTTVTSRARALIKLSVIFAPIAAVLGAVLWALVVPVFGMDFSPAKELVLPLSIAAVLLACYRQTSAWVLAGESPDRLGPLEVMVAIGAALAYPVGILAGGALGAAWASAAVYLLAAVGGQHSYFHTVSGIRPQGS